MDRILVMTGQHLLGEGLVYLLNAGNPGYEVSYCSSLEELSAAMIHAEFQAILLAEPTDGLLILSTIKRIRSIHNPPRIIVLPRRDTFSSPAHLCRLGVHAVLHFDCSPQELQHAVASTIEGRTYMSSTARQQLAAELCENDHFHIKLSYREFEIFSLLIRGYSIEQIARWVSISKKAVSTHKTAIQTCLHTHGLSGMVIYALKHRLLISQEQSGI